MAFDPRSRSFPSNAPSGPHFDVVESEFMEAPETSLMVASSEETSVQIPKTNIHQRQQGSVKRKYTGGDGLGMSAGGITADTIEFLTDPKATELRRDDLRKPTGRRAPREESAAPPQDSHVDGRSWQAFGVPRRLILLKEVNPVKEFIGSYQTLSQALRAVTLFESGYAAPPSTVLTDYNHVCDIAGVFQIDGSWIATGAFECLYVFCRSQLRDLQAKSCAFESSSFSTFHSLSFPFTLLAHTHTHIIPNA
jgi:hypothetical protein